MSEGIEEHYSMNKMVHLKRWTGKRDGNTNMVNLWAEVEKVGTRPAEAKVTVPHDVAGRRVEMDLKEEDCRDLGFFLIGVADAMLKVGQWDGTEEDVERVKGLVNDEVLPRRPHDEEIDR